MVWCCEDNTKCKLSHLICAIASNDSQANAISVQIFITLISLCQYIDKQMSTRCLYTKHWLQRMHLFDLHFIVNKPFSFFSSFCCFVLRKFTEEITKGRNVLRKSWQSLGKVVNLFASTVNEFSLLSWKTSGNYRTLRIANDSYELNLTSNKGFSFLS